MYCKHCGCELSHPSTFCPHCGAFIETQEDYLSTLNTHTSDNVTLDDLRLYVGASDFEYYMKKWRKYLENENSISPSWNWPAFFFGYLWLAYRKMYFLAFLVLPINLISILVNSSAFTSFINWSLCFLLALYGNKLYFHYSKNQIEKIKEKYSTDVDLEHIIVNRGGISTISVGILFLSCFFFAALVIILIKLL